MSDLELAWVAGFFDGEGHTAFRARGKSGRLRLSIGQRHREPLERVIAATGKGRIYESTKLDKPYYTWCVNYREDVKEVIEMLRPYLCSIKVKQADLALANQQQWEAR